MANTLQASFANLNLNKVPEVKVVTKVEVYETVNSEGDYYQEGLDYVNDEQFPDEDEEVYREESERVKQEIINEMTNEEYQSLIDVLDDKEDPYWMNVFQQNWIKEQQEQWDEI